jgi:hypothetical protein
MRLILVLDFRWRKCVAHSKPVARPNVFIFNLIRQKIVGLMVRPVRSLYANSALLSKAQCAFGAIFSNRLMLFQLLRNTAKERGTQRGPQAAEHILRALVSGLALKPQDSFVVVDETPTVGDFQDACLALADQWRGGSEVPYVTCVAVFVKDPVTKKCFESDHLSSRLAGKLLETYWDDQAGPKQPAGTPEDFVTRPELSMLVWDKGHVAKLPDVVINRFDETSGVYQQWQSFCQSKVEELAQMQASRTTVEKIGPAKDHPPLTSPDFSTNPPSFSIDRELVLESVDDADFDLAAVQLICSCCSCYQGN